MHRLNLNPGTRSEASASGWVMLLLYVAIFASVLLHVDEGGQGGRPTLFQLTVFVLSGVLLFRTMILPVGRGTRMLHRYMLVFIGMVLVSCMANLLNTVYVDALATDITTGGSFGKVLLLTLFCLGACGTAYWAGYQTQGNQAIIRKILLAILTAASVNGAAVFVAWLVQTGGVLDRYNFELPLYNSYGLSATMSYTGLLMVFPLWQTVKSTTGRILLLIGALLCLVSAVVIFSRQTTATLLIALVLHTFINMRRRGFSTSKILAVSAVFVGLAIFIGKTMGFSQYEQWYNRLQDESDYSVSGRGNAIYGSLEIFKDHPVLGVGYGFWFAYNNTTFSVVGTEAVLVASPHNGLAALVSEGGVLGTICYLLMNMTALVIAWRASKRTTDPFLGEMADIGFTLLFIYTISQTFSNSLILPPTAEPSCVQYAFVAWLIIGIVTGIESSQWGLRAQAPLNRHAGPAPIRLFSSGLARR